MARKYQEQNTLVNLENYGPYATIAHYDHFSILVSSITKENWRTHYDSILNILKDGIYTERVQRYMINVNFGDFDVDLSLIDYCFNLIMWSMLILTDIPVRPKHIFFSDNIEGKNIKNYIDEFFIDANRSKFDNRTLNNIIADVLQCYHDIDTFAPYLCNTLNLEDSAELMMKDKEYYECLHKSFASYPMDEVKSIGMEYAKKSVARIDKAEELLGHEHCLADALRTGEGINIKQYREFFIGIGAKPDNDGGIFPIVDKSFINGGVTDPMDYFIESSTGRNAQIIKFNNVSTSGTFARILGLNNMDSRLHSDPDYDCGTNHLLPIEVKGDKFLKHLNLMWYREFPNGIERCINYKTDKHLIGKTIYVRTPITCRSAATGHGVCYKCYGNLAYTVFNSKEKIGISIGRIAAEIITSKLTQMQLATKHLLEAMIDKITWCQEFNNFFDLEGNVIQVTSEIDYKDYRILIDPDNIELESDDVADVGDDDEVAAALNFNEYITEFDVVKNSTGEVFHITNDRGEHLFITGELNRIIRRKGEPADDLISIGFNEIKDIPLFVIVLQNNEISKTLKALKDLYNKSSSIRGKTIAQLFQEILDTNIEGSLGISAVHYAILLMNQIRDGDNIFESPNWYLRYPKYQILSLNEALNYNPSITISLSYQKISKIFYSPLTYKKKGASFMDLFFMKRPQRAIKGYDDTPIDNNPRPGESWEPIIFTEDPNNITTKEFLDADTLSEE